MGQGGNVVLLGVRGSVPVSGEAHARYGGGTACVLVRMGGETILLDCGTGLLQAPAYLARQKKLTVLLSHPHVDHLLGLPLCPLLFDREAELRLLAVPRGGLSARDQAAALLSPPLWPVGLEAFRAKVSWEDIAEPAFRIGAVTVEHMEGSHPGGVTVFRLSCGGTSLVYATDCEADQAGLPPLADFAGGCGLLLCDGQFTDEEYAARRGWGHSAWSMAAALSDRCGAGRTVFIHHAPDHTDGLLDEGERWLRAVHPSCSMGRCGEELSL